MNKPPDKDELDAVKRAPTEDEPFRKSFWSRLRRRLAATRRATWGLGAFVIISVALYLLGEEVSDAIKSAVAPIVRVGALLVAAVLANFVGKWMEKHVETWLYRDVKARCRQVDELICAAREMANTKQMVRHVVQSLDEIFGVQGTAIYWANHDGFELVASVDASVRRRLETDELLLRLERYRTPQRGEWSSRSSLGVRLAWPIEAGKRLAGLLVVWDGDGSTAFQEDQEVEKVQPLCDVLAHALLRDDPFEEEKAKFFRGCAKQYADSIAAWFAEKYGVMKRFAEHEALQTNTVTKMRRVLSDVQKELGPEFNGVYVLNEKGLVIEHEAPPGVEIRGKFDASERSYFQLCMSEMGPIVCDSLDTADRKDSNGMAIEILVAAVPRASKKSPFIGILDAVIDVPRAPFSRIAASAAQAYPPLEFPRVGGVRLLLIDSAAIVLGSSDSQQRRRRASMDASPEVHKLRAGLGTHKEFACREGAIVRVAGTPFLAVAYELHDASAWR